MNMAYTLYRFVAWRVLRASVVLNTTILLPLRSMQGVILFLYLYTVWFDEDKLT
jgi:hypothetical protein